MAIDPVSVNSSRPVEWIRQAAGRINRLILRDNGIHSVKNVTGDYTLESNDTFLKTDTSGHTITLDGVEEVGRRVIIKNGFASGTTTVSGTIDGGSSATVPTGYGSLELISDGTQWWSEVAASGGGGSVYSFRRVIGTGTQSVTSTLTAITWNSSAANSGSDVTYAGGNPTRLTAVSAGTYKIGGYVTVQSAAQRAQAVVEIIVNGTATGLQRSGSYIRNSGTSYDYWTMEIPSTPFTLSAADYVELGVGQVNGATYGYNGSLTINCDRSKSEFWLERIA